ncbi:MAG: hypothetical protein CMH57_12100 [Myxococcales bacterium]|nr:hypothetical protein [Myxococcales bacterium]
MRTELIQNLARCLFAASLLLSVGCSDEGETRVDSQTHWLELCETTADCEGGYMCLCGVCTVTCEATSACDLRTEDGEEGSCVTPGSSAGFELCDAVGEAPATGGLCLTACGPSNPSCPDDLLCVDGACIRNPNTACDHSQAPPDGLCDAEQRAAPVLDDSGCIVSWECVGTGACDPLDPDVCVNGQVPVEEVDGRGCPIITCLEAGVCEPGEGYLLAEIPAPNAVEWERAVASCEEMADRCDVQGLSLDITAAYSETLGPPLARCSCVCPEADGGACELGEQYPVGEFIAPLSDPGALAEAYRACLDMEEVCEPGYAMDVVGTPEDDEIVRLDCTCSCASACEDALLTEECPQGTVPEPVLDMEGCVLAWTCVEALCPPVSLPECTEREELREEVDEAGCVFPFCWPIDFDCGGDGLACFTTTEYCEEIQPGVPGPPETTCREIPPTCQVTPPQLPDCACLAELLEPEADCRVSEQGEIHVTIALP